jgi:hypothetical protein
MTAVGPVLVAALLARASNDLAAIEGLLTKGEPGNRDVGDLRGARRSYQLKWR